MIERQNGVRKKPCEPQKGKNVCMDISGNGKTEDELPPLPDEPLPPLPSKVKPTVHVLGNPGNVVYQSKLASIPVLQSPVSQLPVYASINKSKK